MVPMVMPGLSERGKLVVCVTEPELDVAGMLPGTAWVSMSAEEEENGMGGRGKMEEAGGRRVGLSLAASLFMGVSWADNCCCCCNCCS